MIDEEARVPRVYNIAQLILTALMVALLAVAFYSSHSPRYLANRPWVQHVANLPADQAERLRASIEATTYIIPNTRYAPPWGTVVPPDDRAPTSPTMLGYSMREVSLLGMPVLAYRDAGFVLYAEDARHFSMKLLDDDGRRQVDEVAGHPVGRDYVFPFWRYLWGLSLPILIAAWVWIWLRGRDRRREAAGII